jgi:SHS2 domain-containing protein
VAWAFIDELTSADVAFRATGGSLEELFCSSVDATGAVMVGDPSSLEPRQTRQVGLRAESIEMLLYELLEAVLRLKDTDGLFVRVGRIAVARDGEGWVLDAVLQGESLDASRHRPGTDVKAVAMYGFSVRREGTGWAAEVVLDV